ncbi:hypothetical protein AMS68_005344 [Peltaster fructicola]|uniref:Conidiophore development protein hymA n=1 Tax=Peltaster fructicola TaxID=286661 RepID=A0A6H0XYJ7_9PEZI|nr:hypothetical protein AMS68_005344 [Peltaster fructicola]
MIISAEMHAMIDLFLVRLRLTQDAKTIVAGIRTWAAPLLASNSIKKKTDREKGRSDYMPGKYVFDIAQAMMERIGATRAKMAFLFSRNRQRSPQELVRSAKELLQRLVTEEGQQPPQKTEEALAATIAQIKITLQGTPELEVDPQQVFQLVSQILAEGLLPLLVDEIHRLPFEARKDTQTIISNVFRFRNPGSTLNEPDALREVIRKQPDIIIALCNGYGRRESAGPCGGILKEALKWDAVAAVILYDESSGKAVDIYNDVDTSKQATGQGVFWKFFDWIDKSSFEVSADAFDTFRLILTKHKPLVAQFINVNFDLFFDRYNNTLIRSESYVTKRQSIKLLGEVLLDRQFYEVMTRYVSSGDNLKLIMWQLKDDRRMVQYEAFHVFKDVQKFLIMNKERLLRFLPKFLDDRTDDDQFNDEKAWLVRSIGNLPDSVSAIKPPADPVLQTQKPLSTAQTKS